MAELARKKHLVFKGLIVAATLAAAAGIVAGTGGGRVLRMKFKSFVRLDDTSDQVQWVRQRFRVMYRRLDPLQRAVVDAAGMQPDRALYVRANFDSVLVFSPRVMIPDGRRSYRLRPRTKAVWIEWVLPGGLPTSFLLAPDTPAVRRAARAAGMKLLSTEVYNRYGFRGPVPDPTAQVRVMNLGDSFIQGAYLAEDQTPCAWLERFLGRRLQGVRVSVMNTGTPGYSTEQEYYTLVADYDLLKPNVVIVHFFANDVHHDYLSVLHKGAGNWRAAAKWLDLIRSFCSAKGVPVFLLSVIPGKQQMWTADNSDGNYQARLIESFPVARRAFINPLAAMAEANERLKGSRLSRQTDPANPMFLRDDAHFSPEGARCYAEIVGRSVLLALERQGLIETAATARSGRGTAPAQAD